MYITFFPQPTPPEPQVLIHPLKPIDESDSGFKMVLRYQVHEAVKHWSIALKFTKDIRTRNFNIDKAKMAPQKEPTSDSFCLGPQNYNRKLKANCVLRLEFNCHKAQLYEAAPNAFFVFHPNSTECEDFDLPKPGPAVPKESAVAEIIQQWPPNNFKMRFNLQVINSVRGGWKIAVKFSKPVAEISNINKARFVGRSQDRQTLYIENVPGQIQNANLKQCEIINIKFAGKLLSTPANRPLSAFVVFERKEPEYAEINQQGACPTVPQLGWIDNRSHLNLKQ